MRLDFALLARAADAHGGEIFIHGGGLRHVRVPKTPVFYPITVAARFTADIAEQGQEHTMTLRLLAPLQVEPLFTTPALPFDLTVDEPDPDDPQIIVMVALALGAVPLRDEGTYHFELLLDGEMATVLPLTVRATDASSEWRSA